MSCLVTTEAGNHDGELFGYHMESRATLVLNFGGVFEGVKRVKFYFKEENMGLIDRRSAYSRYLEELAERKRFSTDITINHCYCINYSSNRYEETLSNREYNDLMRMMKKKVCSDIDNIKRLYQSTLTPTYECVHSCQCCHACTCTSYINVFILDTSSKGDYIEDSSKKAFESINSMILSILSKTYGYERERSAMRELLDTKSRGRADFTDHKIQTSMDMELSEMTDSNCLCYGKLKILKAKLKKHEEIHGHLQSFVKDNKIKFVVLESNIKHIFIKNLIKTEHYDLLKEQSKIDGKNYLCVIGLILANAMLCGYYVESDCTGNTLTGHDCFATLTEEGTRVQKLAKTSRPCKKYGSPTIHLNTLFQHGYQQLYGEQSKFVSKMNHVPCYQCVAQTQNGYTKLQLTIQLPLFRQYSVCFLCALSALLGFGLALVTALQ